MAQLLVRRGQAMFDRIIGPISTMNASDWAGFIVLVLLIGSVLGGILMFWDATDRFNPGFAFALVLAHIVTYFVIMFPIIVVLYGVYWIYIQRHEARQLEEDQKQRFGLRFSGDPQKEAAKLGLPSVYGGADPDTIAATGRIPELDSLLSTGKAAEALKSAEEMLKTAEGFGDLALAGICRKYIRKIERGEY
jgi:hypothetical protein